MPLVSFGAGLITGPIEKSSLKHGELITINTCNNIKTFMYIFFRSAKITRNQKEGIFANARGDEFFL
jgi:hypothetical protein